MLFADWLDRDDYRQERELAKLLGRNPGLHLIDTTRRATRKKHRLVSDARVLHPDLHGGRDFTIEAVLRHEDLRAALVALGSLSGARRACLLRDLAGESWNEIGEAEQLTRKQVDNALAGARRQIRNTCAA